MNLKKDEWNKSYKNKDNFVFYPNEEIIRFVSKYIRKRTGINEFTNLNNMNKCLDLGCGTGRHVIYLDNMKFEAYGIDISKEAISFAENWCDFLKKNELKNRFIVGSITDMLYTDDFFDFVVSHGVLDSMSFNMSQKAATEVYRVMKKGGLFYFDVVSGCDYRHYREYDGEEIVKTLHENGTIQSYFNWSKINVLLKGKFKIKDAILVQRESVINSSKNSRYHVIAEKI